MNHARYLTPRVILIACVLGGSLGYYTRDQKGSVGLIVQEIPRTLEIKKEIEKQGMKPDSLR